MTRQNCKKNELAFIESYGINNPKVKFLDGVRELLPDGDEHRLDSRLLKIYFDNKWDEMPETRPEGGGSFNGVNFSCVEVTKGDSHVIHLMKAHYNVCRAQSSFFKQELSAEELADMSPRIMNTGGHGLIEVGGKIYLLAHLRGEGVYGTGQLTTAMGGGGMVPAHLESEKHEDPMVATVEDGLDKKMGITDINTLNPNYNWTQHVEPEVGRDCFVAFFRGLNLDYLLDTVGNHNKGLKEKDKKIQVAGFALVPFEKGLIGGVAAEEPEALERIPVFPYDLDNPTEFKETNFREYAKKQGIHVLFRPLAWANFQKCINDDKFMPYFMEQSGF